MSFDYHGSAIRVENLCKSYELGEQRSVLSFGSGKAKSVHWALDNVSFDIPHGQAVGIIGHNGAGKSTLLKLLTRITEPSRGRAVIDGRVAALLEVGTGFHPELTGRENIFMNGSILGMRRAEIVRLFDEIVDFAGVDKFVDTPVKRYSSGMQMRLAFSVAAHLQPEILIVDEVLAVGDVQFQKKCMGKMGDVSRSGRTVLFVSHNMSAVRQLTTRCLLLSRGKVIFDGDPHRAIERYSEEMMNTFSQAADLSSWPRAIAAVDRDVEIRSLEFPSSTQVFAAHDHIRFRITLAARDAVSGVRVSGSVLHPDGYAVGTFWSGGEANLASGEVRQFDVDLGCLHLSPGTYSFRLAIGTGNDSSGHRDFDLISDVLPFEISAVEGEGGMLSAWHPTWGSIRFPKATLTAVDPVGA